MKKRTTAAIVAALASMTLIGCAPEPATTDATAPAMEVDDRPAPIMLKVDIPAPAVELPEAGPEPAQEWSEPEPEAQWEEPEQAWYEPAYAECDGDDFRSQGVVSYDGRTETWYSSNVLQHYRTDEWTMDEDGYWRTDDGYYVVAASDYPQGSVIETSRGEAQVLDSGCADGVTDFYVGW